MIDDWVEIEAPAKQARANEPVTFATVRVGRSDAYKATFSFAESLAADVGWPRYRVEWNRSRKSFRIRGAADGPFEGFHPPRGPKASGEASGGGRRIILRVPLPADLVPIEGRFPAAHEIDGRTHTLIVRVPSRFWAAKP